MWPDDYHIALMVWFLDKDSQIFFQSSYFGSSYEKHIKYNFAIFLMNFTIFIQDQLFALLRASWSLLTYWHHGTEAFIQT